jgi:hypothetical protein
VIKDPAVIVQARREVQPYASQLSDPKAEETLDAALKSSDGQARVDQNKTAIIDAAKETDALLTDIVSPPIRASVVHAFTRSSTCWSPALLTTSRGGAMSTRFGKCAAKARWIVAERAAVPVRELAPDRVISHFDELMAACDALLMT